MDVGDEWIYRKQEWSESERVVICSVNDDKRKRIDVEFMDGEKARQVETAPQGRLKAPWSTVTEYDWLQEQWQTIESDSMADDEWLKLNMVFERVIPESVATMEWAPVRNAVAIHDPSRVSEIFGTTIEAITGQVASFQYGSTVYLSAVGTRLLGKLAATENPLPILAWVMEDEARCRHESKKGRSHKSYFDKGEMVEYSPQHCHEEYLTETRYLHEELRGWCGQEPITLFERSLVAEMEAQRVTLMLVKAIDAVRELGRPGWAEGWEEELANEVVDRAHVRPLVERPLSRFDLPEVPDQKQNRYWRRSYWG